MTYAPPDQDLRAILGRTRTIAVVGLSSNPRRDSHGVASFLQARGFHIIPVNPNETGVLGERAYPTLLDVAEPVDVVNVFRRPSATPEVAERAVAIGAPVLWLQLGIENDEARRIAEDGGLTVIMDLCIRTVVARFELEEATRRDDEVRRSGGSDGSSP
ncbi:MAG TPA: CoA-binding protein [Actinomycetota bacterium]|nr:CoA-binding protein [Actinomycetota bacterium]